MSFLENLIAKLATKATEKMEKIERDRGLIAAYDAHAAGDLAAALKGFEAAAEKDAHAATMAGEMYLIGRGTKVHPGKAIKYLELGVAGGDHDAIALLGMTYASGKPGFKVDFAKARPLLEQAVKNGDEKARVMLELTKAKQRGAR